MAVTVSNFSEKALKIAEEWSDSPPTHKRLR